MTSVFGRFEAERPNDLWTGDALHGIHVGGRLAAALRPALASRGVPQAIYVDNGSAFVDAWLLRACASLGIKLTHSTPGRPQGRGKIERFFKTVRDQFLVEISGDPDVTGRHVVADLLELNRLFAAWVETGYHRAVHSETGQPPLARWQAGGPFPLPRPAALTEAFLWEERRTVTKPPQFPCTATPIRSTPPWSGGRLSWYSTRSTSPPSKSASPGSRQGPRFRITSAATPIPKPAPKPHHPRRRRPGSTTPACSTTPTRPGLDAPRRRPRGRTAITGMLNGGLLSDDRPILPSWAIGEFARTSAAG